MNVAEAAAAALAERFPAGFTWGVATSAYQIEGAVDEDGRGPSIWDVFSHTPGRTRNGENGDVASDHYHRWADDVELMASLGVRAYRFSIAWPRVLPDGTGSPNSKGLDFYERLVDALLEQGIEPVVNLYHWDLPQALQQRGGWTNSDMPSWFAAYASAVAGRLGDRVTRWLTINEPQVFAFTGHAAGTHAPGLRDWTIALRVADTALRAHSEAAQVLRGQLAHVLVGVALDLNRVEAASDRSDDVAAAARHLAIRQGWFLDPLFGRDYPREAVEAHARAGNLDALSNETPSVAALDFLGVNYYTREIIAADPAAPFGLRQVEPDGVPRTLMGWEVHPQGLLSVLEGVQRSYGPRSVLITENGAAFPDSIGGDGLVHDEERRAYLEQHLAAAADAIAAGVPLDGYFVWSLLDNFEWEKGYEQQFGIVRVDPVTRDRSPKASGAWYRELLAAWRRRLPSG